MIFGVNFYNFENLYIYYLILYNLFFFFKYFNEIYNKLFIKLKSYVNIKLFGCKDLLTVYFHLC